jgi:pimeloyl-ACP methyl ester carboxylesterase
MTMMNPVEFDIALSSGTVHAARWGAPDAPLTFCVHGLSANLHAFDFLAERLAGPHRQFVAIDLRGRGRSDITPPGTYGLAAHAEDVLEAATALGADRFDYLGWSLGALIGITAAGVAAERLRTLTLIDHCGQEEPAANAAVRKGLDRLDAVVDRPEDYVARIRDAGFVDPWSEYWTRIYTYELTPLGERFTPRTDKAACLEDLDRPDRARVRDSWPKIGMPALLVRATTPLNGADVVPVADRDALRSAAADLRVVELPTNHFGVVTHPGTAAAVAELLGSTPVVE